MSYLLVILQILALLPELVKLVHEIIALIKDLPHDKQVVAKSTLTSIVSGLKAKECTFGECGVQLEAFAEVLRAAREGLG